MSVVRIMSSVRRRWGFAAAVAAMLACMVAPAQASCGVDTLVIGQDPAELGTAFVQ